MFSALAEIVTRLVAVDSCSNPPTSAPWVLSVWLAFHFARFDFESKNVVDLARVVIFLMTFPVVGSYE